MLKDPYNSASNFKNVKDIATSDVNAFRSSNVSTRVASQLMVKAAYGVEPPVNKTTYSSARKLRANLKSNLDFSSIKHT